MIELKPCPFCGNSVQFEKAYSLLGMSVIYCNDCDMFFTLDAINASDDDICEAWNRRSDDAELVRHGSWKGWTSSRFTGKYKDYDEPEFKDYKYYQCSECYRKSAIKELYCPSCGSKMDKG